MDLPDITEIQRLTLRPGDRIVVHADADLSLQAADMIKEKVRRGLSLGPDVNILVVGRGMSIITVDGQLTAGDDAQIREVMRAAMDHPGKAASIGHDGTVLITDVGDL
jgi:hypothetical protein